MIFGNLIAPYIFDIIEISSEVGQDVYADVVVKSPNDHLIRKIQLCVLIFDERDHDNDYNYDYDDEDENEDAIMIVIMIKEKEQRLLRSDQFMLTEHRDRGEIEDKGSIETVGFESLRQLAALSIVVLVLQYNGKYIFSIFRSVHIVDHQRHTM